MPSLHTLTDFKTMAGGFSDSTALDAEIELLMELIYSRIEDEIGRVLEKDEVTETFRRCTTPYLPLKRLPIDTAADVTVIERYYSSGVAVNTTLTENDDYYVLAHGIELAGFTAGYDYVVTYTGGYAPDTNDVLILPQEAQGLRRAALYQLMHEWNTHKKPGDENIQTAIGNVTTVGLKLLDDVKRSLRYYRHPAREMMW